MLENYERYLSGGDFVAPPDIRRKMKSRRTQKKRRLTQRRAGKKGGKRK